MNRPISMISFFLGLLVTSSVGNPFGVFDFDLRGGNPAQQIRSVERVGFDGITMSLKKPAGLKRLQAYKAAKPDLRLFAGLYGIDYSNPEDFDRKHLRQVLETLSSMDAKLWLILGGPKGDDIRIAELVREVADLAAEHKVGVSIYPHDNQAIETAEEALVIVNMAKRSNLTISVHQCHEMRAGNTDRLDAVMDAVGPLMDIVTICGSDTQMHGDSKDWSDAIKPLGKGDFDPQRFLRALKRHHFKGPIILHTFGLMDEPASHYQKSFDVYQKMKSEVDTENP